MTTTVKLEGEVYALDLGIDVPTTEVDVAKTLLAPRFGPELEGRMQGGKYTTATVV
jgi:hypothetical protein